MNAFTIKDLENLSGIKAHTIRIWEQRYHFLKPQRTATNIRFYSNEELKTVLNVALLNKSGLKMAQIDRMTQTELTEKILGLRDPKAQSERVIHNMIRDMVDLDMAAFESELNRHIRTEGLEKTITRLVFPFLEKIGILWTTGHINPAQEHLVSGLIRQKLIAGIEQTSGVRPLGKNFLLFLPEGEHHELGLLYVHYLLKLRGAGVIYLGADVPLADMGYVARVKSPDYLYTHLTGGSWGSTLDKWIQQLRLQVPAIPLVISGGGAPEMDTASDRGLILLHSLSALQAFTVDISV
jgi:MerR family transcriptional regulator, light-induced transcriptional regulator